MYEYVRGLINIKYADSRVRTAAGVSPYTRYVHTCRIYQVYANIAIM